MKKSADVFLPPVQPSVYSESAMEPQYVTTVAANSGWIYLDSRNTPYGTDRTNCTISSNSAFATNIFRIRVMGISALWYIPNVNPRNNTLSFKVNNSPVTYTVTLPERFYDPNVPADVTQLTNDIKTALNGAGSGATFDIFSITGYPRKYGITSTLPFYFDPECSAVLKGVQMYNFQREIKDQEVFETSKSLGPMSMFYSQYVDIKSSILTRWQKIQSTTSGNLNPVLFRSYIGENQWGVTYETPRANQVAWKASEPIYQIDFAFYDQNGDPLYAPNNGKDFEWQISLSVEI